MNEEEFIRSLQEETRASSVPSGVGKWRHTVFSDEPITRQPFWKVRPAARFAAAPALAITTALTVAIAVGLTAIGGHSNSAPALSPRASAIASVLAPHSTSSFTPSSSPAPTPTGLAHTLTPAAPGAQNPAAAVAARVWAWGDNSEGYVGNGSSTEQDTPVTMNFPTGTRVQQIASGYVMSEVLLSNGTVWGTGRAAEGEMGNGVSAASVNFPTQAAISNVTSVAAGQYTVYAAKSDGTVWAWGFNGYGQVGDGTTVGRHTPVQVIGLSNVVEVAGQGFAGMALRSDGTVWAWGDNDHGQLGNGTQCSPNGGCVGSTVPVQVQGLTGVVALAGGRQFALALKSNGTVWAWGAGSSGQLGNGGNTFAQSTPVQVSGLSSVVAIAAGAADGMALRSNGTVEMWGYNGDGEIGNNNAPNDVYVPTPVFSGATSIAAGYSDSFAIKQGGTLWAWGSDATGDLGIGSHNDQRNAPVLVPALSPVIAISAGIGSTIALS